MLLPFHFGEGGWEEEVRRTHVKTVKLWRVSKAEEIVTLSGHLDSVSAVAVSKVTQLIASGSQDKTIKLWQLVEQDNS